MRLCIGLRLDREATLPVDHQHLLMGLVYDLLGASDPDFARFLHDEGYRVEGEGSKRFKLFVYSGLRAPKGRRRVEGATLRLAPGRVEWLVGSPRDDFLLHCATGLLSAGSEVRVGSVALTVMEVQALPEPAFAETTRFTCLTPIVASVPREDRTTQFLRPADGVLFSEAVRKNLLHKHARLYGGPPEDDRLSMTFDPDYLARNPHGGTKKATFKGIEIVGAFAPFTLTGSSALMRLGYDAGFGEKNGIGFGMAEIREEGTTREEGRGKREEGRGKREE